MPPSPATTAALDSSDVAVAQRIAAGDRDELRRLMRRYNQTLYRTARSILKDDAEAEDAVQEAYLQAYRAMGTFRGGAKLSTWLIRIVVNEAVGRARKRDRRAQLIPLSATAIDDEATEVPMDDDARDPPERAALRAETRRLLEAKIDELPEAFRTVFVLRALEELTVDEAAACLDIPAATVRSRYFRAKGLLREALAREIDTSFDEAFAFAGKRCDRIVAGVLERLDGVANTGGA